MNREDTIKDIAQYVCGACELDMTCKRDYGEFTYTCCDNALSPAVKIYEAGYRKTFTSDIASDTQKAFKEGYEKARKETAKRIFQKVVNICIKEEDFQDGTVNTQLEPLYFGIMNGCAFIRNEVKEIAKQYGVEVEE